MFMYVQKRLSSLSLSSVCVYHGYTGTIAGPWWVETRLYNILTPRQYYYEQLQADVLAMKAKFEKKETFTIHTFYIIEWS